MDEIARQTQQKDIREYIDTHGSITTFEAYEHLYITKLTTRISEMRKRGEEFIDSWETGKNHHGKIVRYKRYRRP